MAMDIGFETIGNATIVCYDHAPILVTDPWIVGDAYFGSWTLSHEIPEDIMSAILRARFIWISHGHPDHLSMESLELLRGKQILLPDHVGNRILNDLSAAGFHVTVLRDYEWHSLSDHIRVMSIADYNQDAILLIDINGRLIFNANDAFDHGWAPHVRRIIRQYDVSFLMALSGFGDSDMIHFYTEDGTFIQPQAARRDPVGVQLAYMAHQWGTRYVVPFSSMHRYQRSDSFWADAYTTRIPDYEVGFASDRATLMPAFLRYDCERDRAETINPLERDVQVRPSDAFGDRWDEPLTAEDQHKLTHYFQSIAHLAERFDFLNFRVGGNDHIIPLATRHFNRAITFEAPRGSLMTAVEYGVFDDMLIANFMKTTLHGQHPAPNLYPDFEPFVAKYADNGNARSKEEVIQYFREYRRRAPIDFFRHHLSQKSMDVFRQLVPPGSPGWKIARQAYHLIR